jgi:hypothetical protein
MMIIDKLMIEDREGNSCGVTEVLKNTTKIFQDSRCPERYSKRRKIP